MLLALIGFSPIGPAVFTAHGPELPACCLKGGKHHCAMPAPRTDGAAGGGIVSSKEKCSSYPVGAFSGIQSFAANTASNRIASLSVFAHPTGVEQARALYRVSLESGWQKRGPPSFLS